MSLASSVTPKIVAMLDGTLILTSVTIGLWFSHGRAQEYNQARDAPPRNAISRAAPPMHLMKIINNIIRPTHLAHSKTEQDLLSGPD